jgi:hypothetical protein
LDICVLLKAQEPGQGDGHRGALECKPAGSLVQYFG